CWRGLNNGGNRGGLEANVVGPPANHDELDAVALLDGDVGGLEVITLGIADHIDRDVLGGDRSRRGRAARRRGGGRSSSCCRRFRVDCAVRGISRRLFSTSTGD